MLYPLARHFLFKLNPEQAHDLSIKYLPRLLGTPLDCFFRHSLPTIIAFICYFNAIFFYYTFRYI
jgi:hypothetical protein